MDLQALCLPLKARSFEIEGSDIPGLRILGISGAEGFAFFFVWLGSVFFFVWLGSAGLWRKVFFFLRLAWLGSFLRLAWLGRAWGGRRVFLRKLFFLSSSGLARLFSSSGLARSRLARAEGFFCFFVWLGSALCLPGGFLFSSSGLAKAFFVDWFGSVGFRGTNPADVFPVHHIC